MEVLTRELIESEFAMIVETKSKEFGSGAVRWSWDFMREPYTHDTFEDTPMSGTVGDIDAFKFRSHEAAWNYAMGWIRRNRPSWWGAAKRQAEEGVRYRNIQKAKARSSLA